MPRDGDQIGAYLLRRSLGEGPTGRVFLAEARSDGTPVAVKVLHAHVAEDQAVVERVLADAQTASRLTHAGVVRIVEAAAAPVPMIAMELLRGESLGAALARVGSLTPERSLAIIGQISTTLAAAHAIGLLHGDLTPENLFLLGAADDPEIPAVRVLDFGAVHAVSSSWVQRGARTGSLLGSPLYLSPEQCRAALIDARADVYALGCILFEMIAGRPPFVREVAADLITAHISEPPPRLSAFAEIAPELDELVGAMLWKDAALRPTMAAVAKRLAPKGAIGSADQRRQLEDAVAPLRSGLETLQRSPEGIARDHATEVVARTLAALFPMLEQPGAVENAMGPLRPLVDGLLELHLERARLVKDVEATFADVQASDAAVSTLADALRRLSPSARERLASMAPLPRLVASAHLADRDATAHAFDLIHALPPVEDALAPAIQALRMADVSDTGRRARALFLTTRHPPLRALLIPALVERGRIGAKELLGALDDQDIDVIAAAATALAWTGDRALASALRTKANGFPGAAGADALLFAAACLDPEKGLADVRARLSEADVGPAVFDAAAVLGDNTDVGPLLRHASRGGRDGARALAAAAHIGAQASWPAIASAARELETPLVLRGAQVPLFGDGGPGGVDAGREPTWPGRARRVLSSASALLLHRRWTALRVSLRHASGPDAAYDPTASAARQLAAAAQIDHQLPAQTERLSR